MCYGGENNNIIPNQFCPYKFSKMLGRTHGTYETWGTYGTQAERQIEICRIFQAFPGFYINGLVNQQWEEEKDPHKAY